MVNINGITRSIFALQRSLSGQAQGQGQGNLLTNVGNPVQNQNINLSVQGSGNSTTASFSNFTPLAIPTAGLGIPYPSTINVSGLPGTIIKVSVIFHAYNSLRPEEQDILLVGPGGQSVYLMASAGGNAVVTNQTITFDDSATGKIPDAGPLVTGVYQPSVYPPTITFPLPAPPPPYGALFNVFNGTNPNGTWSLYTVDDINQTSDTLIAGGWTLLVTVA